MGELDDAKLDMMIVAAAGGLPHGSMTPFSMTDVGNLAVEVRRLREYLREKNDIIKAYAGPTGMTPEDVAAAMERIPELERECDRLGGLLADEERMRRAAQKHGGLLMERAELVEAAARPVAYADVRICALCQPDRYHEHAANCPVMALRAALADVPAEPSATFTGDYADAAAGYEALADEPDEEGE